jgi:hypothetical protein
MLVAEISRTLAIGLALQLVVASFLIFFYEPTIFTETTIYVNTPRCFVRIQEPTFLQIYERGEVAGVRAVVERLDGTLYVNEGARFVWSLRLERCGTGGTKVLRHTETSNFPDMRLSIPTDNSAGSALELCGPVYRGTRLAAPADRCLMPELDAVLKIGDAEVLYRVLQASLWGYAEAKCSA